MSGLLLGKLAFITGLCNYTFSNRIVVTLNILGAGSGIGRATCQIMAREGATIIAADRKLETAKDTITTLSKPDEHLSIEVNVGEFESIKNVAASIIQKYQKPPTVIVNCAGITRDNFLLKLSHEDFDEVINVNLKVIVL